MNTKNKTTLHDLNLTAFAAAQKALEQNTLDQAKTKLAEFSAAGHDAADYETWEGFFNGHLATFRNYKTRLSPAGIAAAAAAAPKPLEAAQ